MKSDTTILTNPVTRASELLSCFSICRDIDVLSGCSLIFFQGK
jgi:hypothetical protein